LQAQSKEQLRIIKAISPTVTRREQSADQKCLFGKVD